MADELVTAMLKQDEGLKLVAYFDTTGNLTVGYGHKVLPQDGIRHGDTITQEDADKFLAADIEIADDAVNDAFFWLQALDEPRQAVIVSMVYNMGINSVLEFKRTLAAIQAHDWQEASDGMMASLWAQEVGDRARRLSYIMETGDPTTIPKDIGGPYV